MLKAYAALKPRLPVMRRFIASKPGAGKTVAVAMSGGIDSAVAALLLQDQGYNCVGVFMKNWDPADECGSATCDISADVIDMKQVCRRLNIPSYEVDFVKEYWTEVFVPFLEAYQTGVETPNPDAFCNRFVKFKHFRKYVTNKLGIDTIATGHYSCMVDSNTTGVKNGIIGTDSGNSSSGVQMLKGRDPLKDQSYFLALTKGSALKNVLFPLGQLTKAEVKHIAHTRLPGLNILTKHESMGICFIGKRDMKDFLQDYITLTKGRFIDLDTGKVVGKHENFEYYTIGQKARIPNFNAKYYVVGRKRTTITTDTTDHSVNTTSADSASVIKADATAAITTNTETTNKDDTDVANSHNITTQKQEVSGDVYVVNDLFHPALFTPYIIQPLSGINWLAGFPPEALLATLYNQSTTNTDYDNADNITSTSTSNDAVKPFNSGGKKKVFRCEVKCRYSQLPTGCTMELVHDPALLAYNNSNYNVVHANLSSNNHNTNNTSTTNHTNTSNSSTVIDNVDKLDNVMIKIVFDVPQRAITPGQILAIYEKEVVLGGAVIAVQPLHLANGELLML